MRIEQIAYKMSQDLTTRKKYEVEITQECYDDLSPSDYEITVKGIDADNTEARIRLITEYLAEAERAMKYLHEKIMTGNIHDLLLIDQEGDLMGKIHLDMFGY
tara:strand:+ start:42 stop:350 length:309 start_codon:yes stop_codon:yes gene_type:complete